VTVRNQYTNDEWEILRFVPWIVMAVVASADGNPSQAEQDILEKLIRGAPTLAPDNRDYDLVREILVSQDDDAPVLMERLEAAVNSGWSLEDILRAAGNIASAKAPAGQATCFKNSMVAFAVEVANASGPLFGSKVSVEERKSVTRIRSFLGA
jgi:hypothetical protein